MGWGWDGDGIVCSGEERRERNGLVGDQRRREGIACDWHGRREETLVLGEARPIRISRSVESPPCVRRPVRRAGTSPSVHRTHAHWGSVRRRRSLEGFTRSSWGKQSHSMSRMKFYSSYDNRTDHARVMGGCVQGDAPMTRNDRFQTSYS